MPTPVKHHFVSRFLLRNFAHTDGRLAVHRLKPSTTYLSNVVDVGHQNDGHTLYRLDGTPDRVTFEQEMSSLESRASQAIPELDHGHDLTDHRRSAISWFLALQWLRSRYLLDSVHKMIDHNGLSPEQAQTTILRAVLFPFLAAYSSHDDPEARPRDSWDQTQYVLDSFAWTLCRFRDGSLLVGDQTLCLSGVRPGGHAGVNSAWARHGIATGLNDVARVTAPLTHRLGLLVTPGRTASRMKATAFNRTTVYNARRFVTHAPEWPYEDQNLQNSFSDALDRQRMLAPAFFKNQFWHVLG